MKTNISNIPDEILCKIINFLPVDTYFSAIESNIFPIDWFQYKRNLDIRINKEKEHELIVEAREKYKRIRQGKMLILSCVKEFFPQYQDLVDLHIHEWNDEIDRYFTDDQNNGDGIATKILNFVLNESKDM